MSNLYRTIGKQVYRYDTDFQTNVLDVAASLKFLLPEKGTCIALDKFMRILKFHGVFQILDTFANFALNNAGLSNFSLIDWKRTGIQYNPQGGVYYTINGWEGNAISGYIDTRFNPAVGNNKYTVHNASRAAILYKYAVSSNFIDGNIGGQHMRNLNTTQQRICSSLNINQNADLTGSGLKAINRDSTNTVRLYNKNVEISRTASSSIITNGNYWILRSTGNYGDAGISSYMMGASISQLQMKEIRNAYNIMLTQLGLPPYA